jgi:hypothetical protein
MRSRVPDGRYMWSNLADQGDVMSTVVIHNVVSVDGYIADDNDDVGPLFDWYPTATPT